MEPYRKPDAYYEDEYDRYTINELKAIQKKEEDELNAITTKEDRIRKEIEFSISNNSFGNSGIRRARNRTSAISVQRGADDQRDQLVQRHPTPYHVKCNECGVEMLFNGHMFDVKKIPILFVFDCPHGHFPRKVVYPNGGE